MIENCHFRVTPAEDGLRLDVFLQRRLPNVLRRLAADAIAGGEVSVNGRFAGKGTKLKPGDEVLVRRILEASDLSVLPDDSISLDVIYEDAHLVVVNKPAGIPVHPLKPQEKGTLANALVARYPETAHVGDQPLFPAFAHRLDTETSGVMVAARDAATYVFLRNEFRRRRVRKVYLALVLGRVRKGGRLEHWLAHDVHCPGRMVVVTPSERFRYRRPLLARSSVRVLEVMRSATLLEVEIETGVTHQIRCQLAAMGYPIAGDSLYGRRASSSHGLSAARQCLHAARLGLRAPTEPHANLTFVAPLPADFQAALLQARRALPGPGRGIEG